MPFLPILLSFAKTALISLGVSWLASKFGPKAERTPLKPSDLSEWDFPTASETRSIPDVIGTARIDAPNTLWRGDFHTTEVTERVRKDMFSKTNVQIGNNYAMGLALGLCLAAPGARLRAVYADDRLAWIGNITSGQTANLFLEYGEGKVKNGIKGTLEFYSGSLTPSAYLQRQLGEDQAQAYSHLTYVVFRGLDGATMNGYQGELAPNGWIGTRESLPKLSFVVENTSLVPDAWLPQPVNPALRAEYLARSSIAPGTTGSDANPAYALYRLELHDAIGSGLPPEYVDFASFHAAAQVLFTEGNGVSMAWDSARSVAEMREQLEQQVNGMVYADPVTGVLKLRLIRADDAPVLDIGPHNVKEGGLRSFTRTAQDRATNEISVPFKDRQNGFIDRVANAQDLGAIAAAGQVNSASVQFPGVATAPLASALALREARAASSFLGRLTATVMTDRTDLRPGDVATFSWGAPLNIGGMRMRLVSVEYREAYGREVDIEAVEDVFRSGTAAFSMSLPPVSGSGPAPTALAHRSYMIPAPWALAQSESDRMMLLVSPSAADQRTFDVLYNEVDSINYSASTALQDPNGPYPLMVSGDATADISDTADSLAISLTAANGALMRSMSTAGGLLCLIGYPAWPHADGYQAHEFVRVSGFTVAADGLSATLTMSKRGIFDTYPGRWTVANGAQVWLIPRPVIDPSGLSSALSSDMFNEPIVQVFGGEAFSRPFYWMRGTTGRRAVSPRSVAGQPYGLAQDGTAGRLMSRACRPVNAGEPRINGIAGKYARTDPGLPQLSRNNGAWTISWKNRAKGSLSDPDTAWATGTGAGLPSGVVTFWKIQEWFNNDWRIPLSSAGGVDASCYGTVSNGTESVLFFPPLLLAGRVIRVIVRHELRVNGVTALPYGYGLAENDETDVPVARVYQVT